jgi:hypothetical protein
LAVILSLSRAMQLILIVKKKADLDEYSGRNLFSKIDAKFLRMLAQFQTESARAVQRGRSEIFVL